MTRTSLAILIIASLVALQSEAVAEDSLSPAVLDQPLAAPTKAANPAATRRKAQKKATASTGTATPTSAPDSERAAALARGRKKFFEQGREQSESPYDPMGGSSARPTLGGGNGFSPGMQFKF